MKSSMDYLRVKLAPTLMGVKPAVLLTLKDCRRKIASDLYTFYMGNREMISESLEIEIFELKNCGNCAKILFYKEDLLKKAVFDKWRNRYLSKSGYGKCNDPDDFLEVLKGRFNMDSFPHEIGIFLGYPLKDVAGFCHCPEKSRKGIGRTPWKIFGNPIPSFKIINSHRNAINQMLLKISEDVNPQLQELFSIQPT